MIELLVFSCILYGSFETISVLVQQLSRYSVSAAPSIVAADIFQENVFNIALEQRNLMVVL